ncbi:MAG: hypothetical protein JWM59_2853 [Verrucomicrobiales bacterium]|nr:hypothetical protein [Verrucomicrobiales bacterium]
MNCRRLSHAGPGFWPVLAGVGLLLAGWALTGCSKKPKKSLIPASLSPVAAAALNELAAGRPVSAVWLEETSVKKGAPPARQLFVYRTADQKGIHRLGVEGGDLARPLVSPDGKGVVLTRLGMTRNDSGFSFAPQVLWQGWDGSASKPLGVGMAVELWTNPADGTTMVYAVETLQPSAQLRLTGEKLVRFRTDKPEDREIIWTETPLNAEQFQISRDGRRAAGAFPFPKAGLANLETQTFTSPAPGAWAALASDDSYALAVLDGTRKRLRCFAPNMDRGWELTLSGAAGWPEGGLLHPRWSNDPRVLTFTGPYPEETTAADIWLLRLRDDLRRVEKVARLTEGRKALTPSVLIEGGTQSSSLPQEPVVVPKPEPKPWPSTEDGLVFAWESAKPGREKPLPMAPGSLTPQGFATVGRHFEMNLSGGWYEADEAAAARIAQACAASSAWSMELILTERTTQPPVSVRLAALMRPDGRGEQFALYRVDRRLVLRVLLGGTPERPPVVYPVVLTNLAIEGDRPVQVIVTLRNNRLSCWVDGQMMKSIELESSGFAGWGAGKLIFGDPQPYGTPWTGWMERVAVYSRALSDEECRTSSTTADQWIQGRTRPTRSKVQAKLIETVPAASPAAGQDGDALSLSTWEVDQVFMGQVDEKRIAVAQWDRLRSKAVPPVAVEPGKSGELWLELWEDHPELEGVTVRPSPQAAGLRRYFLGRPLAPPAATP